MSHTSGRDHSRKSGPKKAKIAKRLRENAEWKENALEKNGKGMTGCRLN
jgi:hypothetical protein